MDRQRQEAFQKLRLPCVELSSVGLKFKANQVATRDVLHAIEAQHRTLKELSITNHLDAKLAEYAFFPLTHIFNESQRLSSRCLEVAVQSVDLLVSHGWRGQLAPEMGKQLLILMSLLSGGDPRKNIATPSDELKAAAFECIASVLKWLGLKPGAKLILRDQSTKNIIDQLTYLLADSLSESISDSVQLAASHALSELFSSISDRVFLASILPRTVSSLVKALRPSTQARRTHKVLCSNLALLGLVMSKTLADDVVAQAQATDGPEAEALDESWLKATSAQVKTALTHVTKLRNHDSADVRTALAGLCIMVIEDCSKSLHESISVMLETLVILAGNDDDTSASKAVKHLVISKPGLMDTLRASLYDWTQSLPRIMQANDDGPKTLMLKRVSNAYNLLGENMEVNDNMVSTLTTTMLNSVANSIDQDKAKLTQISDLNTNSFLALEGPTETTSQHFLPVLLCHQSQQMSTQELNKWIQNVKGQPQFGKISRTFVDAVSNVQGSQKLAALWLAIQLLKRDSSNSFDMEDLILTDSSIDRSTSRSYLIHDLYSVTKDMLIESAPYAAQDRDWRLTALSLEVLILQAQQMGKDYRNELYETLYPVLANFSSKNDVLQNNAVATLNLLATACQYDTAKQMLIENVDYLVNSIAWKLNTFALSPEAPRVLDMVVRLVGARLMPYLDDLIASIFAALDSFHGYSAWVEMLFTVLKTMVDESAKQPTLAITESDQQQSSSRRTVGHQPTSISDIVETLRARKKRKFIHDSENISEDSRPESAPKRPWTREQDDPRYKPPPSEQEELSLESLLKQDEEGDLPAPSTGKTNEEDDPMKPKSKSHDLLLKIAQSTVPHLSSPSPRVRHLLLQLLLQIAPLLSRHENTFLPLINAVWPAIVPRLFADQINEVPTDFSNQDTLSESMEYPYNIVAAVELIAVLCENAGDFMSSRVEQIFRQLIKLYMQTLNHVEGSRRTQARSSTPSNYTTGNTRTIRTIDRQEQSSPAQITIPSSTSKSTPSLEGTVDLRIVHHAPSTVTQSSTLQSQPQPQSHAKQIDSVDRTSQSQILSSLINLLTSILTNVRLQADKVGEIIDALEPFVTRRPTERVIAAIESYNPDILWLMRERDRIEREIDGGVRVKTNRHWNVETFVHGGRVMEVVF